MNTVTATKSAALNHFEGMMLTGVLQAMPIYAGAAMILKLVSHMAPVSSVGGPAMFVLTTSILHAVVTPWLAPKYPKMFRHSYEPLFFDASLSLAEKVSRWRTQPMASLQMLANVVMMSLLGVAVLSVG